MVNCRAIHCSLHKIHYNASYMYPRLQHSCTLAPHNSHQNDVPTVPCLLHQLGDPVLQLSALLGPSHEQANIQLQHTLVAQEGWQRLALQGDIVDNGTGQALSNCCLADTCTAGWR